MSLSQFLTILLAYEILAQLANHWLIVDYQVSSLHSTYADKYSVNSVNC